MADTPNPGETVIPEAPSNVTVQTPAATPVANAVDPTEVERLKKDAEQARLRANQLENELKKRSDADAEAERKKLEENNEYKTLAEQEKARREELERKETDREQKEALDKARTTVLTDFPDEVKKQAEELGISLTSDDETDVEIYKGKLEKLNTAMTNAGRVTPNNGRPQNTDNVISVQDIRSAGNNQEKFDELIAKRFPDGGIAAMRRQQ